MTSYRIYLLKKREKLKNRIRKITGLKIINSLWTKCTIRKIIINNNSKIYYNNNKRKMKKKKAISKKKAIMMKMKSLKIGSKLAITPNNNNNNKNKGNHQCLR